MKAINIKTALTLAVFLMAGGLAHAQQDTADPREGRVISINWGLGSIGLGGIFPFGGGYSRVEGSLSTLEVGVEHNETRLGFTLSPFSSFSWDDSQSLLNLYLYWNAISQQGIFMGPFASGNYVFFEDGFRPGKYSFAVGMRGGFRMETGMINMNFVSMETGFRMIDGKANWFVGGKIDFFPLIFAAVTRPLWWVFRW